MREDDILSSLNKYFHYESLRPGQLPVILKILDERDVIVCKETGFGKSLCFQLPGMMRQGLVVVIGNLLSRIERKCQELSSKNIKFVYLNSIVCNDLPAQNQDLRIVLKNKSKVWEDLRCIETSKLKFLYVTFEYLIMNCDKLKSILEDIYRKNMLQAIVVDEINYSSQWIDSFRRDYSILGAMREAYPQTSFLCFTGPLSQEKFSIVKDILNLQHPYTLNEPSTRMNVSYHTMYVDEKLPVSRLVEFIKECHHGESGIVYCFNEKDCQELVTSLKSNNVSGIIYRDKLTDTEKDWINNVNEDGIVIVCLTGWPIDLDFKKIDFTIHSCMPEGLDIYIEETKNVGKNGAEGTCIMLYNKEDSESFLDSVTGSSKEKISKANPETKKQLLAELNNYRRELFQVTIYAENQSVCRQLLMLKYLNDDNVVEPCGVCDVCVVMRESYVVDMSYSLKKILMAIWAINRKQKGIKHEDYAFGSITFLLDLLLGESKKYTFQLSNEWFFGSFGSWDQNTLHTLIIILLIHKFASINLVIDNEFTVYQNLIITPKGQQFTKTTWEFGVPFSCKDVKITKWLDFAWVKNQFLNDLKAIVQYYQKHGNFNVPDYMYCCVHLSSYMPGTLKEFQKIMACYNENKLTDLHKDLFESCLMYHHIRQSLKNGVGNNKAIYNFKVRTPAIRVAVSGRF